MTSPVLAASCAESLKELGLLQRSNCYQRGHLGSAVPYTNYEWILSVPPETWILYAHFTDEQTNSQEGSVVCLVIQLGRGRAGIPSQGSLTTMIPALHLPVFAPMVPWDRMPPHPQQGLAQTTFSVKSKISLLFHKPNHSFLWSPMNFKLHLSQVSQW